MSQRRLRLTALLVSAALVGALVPGLAAAQQAEQRQLQEASDRLAAVSDDIDEAVDEADDAEAELEDADERLAEVEAIVNDVASAVDRQRGAVREAQQQLDVVEEEAQETFDAFGERAARMYKEGPNLSFQVLLGSDDVEGAMWRTSYLRAATQADRATLESLDAAERRVEAERQRLAEEQERLEGMLAEQEELLEEVTRLRESRALAAADARAEVEQLEAEQDDLEDEQAELEELIRQRQEEARREAEREAEEQRRAEEAAQAEAEAEAEARRQREREQEAQQEASPEPSSSPPSSSNGSNGGSSSNGGGDTSTSSPSSSGYAWPLCAPVTSEYGPRWGRMHRGIDQGASTGTAIGASKAGTVIFAGRQGGYGNLVLIDHADGVVTAYAHMSRIGTSQGASVSQGENIGAVGSTGNSTGPHLHFETRVNGNAVNPRQYLSGSPC